MKEAKGMRILRSNLPWAALAGVLVLLIGLTPTVLAQSQSSDATLSALTLSDVDFGTFASSTATYTASVANRVRETTVTPTVNHSGATYVIKLGGVEDSDGEVSLNVGGNVITVEVTAEDRNANQTYTVTVTRAENSPPTGKPTISGTPEVGGTLKGDISNMADEDGIVLDGISSGGATYEFDWWIDICDGYPGILGGKYVYADPSDSVLYNTLGPDSEQAEFELTSYAAGYGVLLQVGYLDGGHNSESVWSDSTDVVPGPIESLTLVDTSDGSDVATLQCSVPNVRDPDEIVLDANGSYTIRAELADDADVGSISWEVKRNRREFASGTDNGGGPYTLFGEGEDDSPLGRGFPAGLYVIQVEAYSESDLGGDHLQRVFFIKFRVNNPATGSPTISGTAQVGQTLTADTSDISDHDGLTNVTYSYQWLADDTEIDGATGSTYTVQSTDNGKVIKVRVTFTDDGGSDETVTSEGTSAVVMGGL